MRLALTFYSVLKMPIEDIISCSNVAEGAGFEYISMAESFYRDASVLAAAIASRTKKVKFGSSIFPIHTRTPFQIAMATATLHEFTKGRMGFIGLGSGYKSRIETYFGVNVENSLLKMEEFVDVVRGLLRSEGDSFSYPGRFFNFHSFPRLVPKPLSVPILVAAAGNRMLELAAKKADGIILNSIGTPEYYRHVLSILREASKEAGRTDIDKFEVASSIIFSVADRYEDAIEAARPDVLFYLLYPELDPVIEKTPYKQQAMEIRKLSAQGNQKEALSLVTDRMIEDLTVSGTREDCKNKIKRLADFGITLPIIRVSVQTFKESDRREVFLRAIEVLKG